MPACLLLSDLSFIHRISAMRIFKDINGKDWVIDIHLGSLELVREVCCLDLTKLFEDDMKPIGSLFADPYKLASVIWTLVSPPNSPESARSAFMMAFRADAIEAAAMALVDAVIDFFPSPQRRETLRELVKHVWEVANGIEKEAAELVKQIKPAEVLEKLKSTSLNSAGSSAESPVSTPAP